MQLRREEGDVRHDRPRGPAAVPADRGHTGSPRSSTPSSWPRRTRSPARQFLDQRGFDQAAAGPFGVGFAPRDGEALLRAPAAEAVHATRSRSRPGWSAQGRSALRPLPRAAALADPRRHRRHHRLRRPADLRRRQDRGEVPQHPRDPDLQEEPGALRHRPGPPRHRPLLAGGRRRGLHRRDGLPPGRRTHRGRHLRHGVRRRARPGAAPLPARPRGVPRRGDLHLRRRRGRPEGRAAGLRRRPELRLPDLRRRRARPGWTRATCGSSRATPRCASWSPGGCRSTASCSPTSSRKYDLDRADGRVDALREAARLVASASATSPRSTRSPASSPAWSGVDIDDRPAPRYAAPRAPGRPRPQPGGQPSRRGPGRPTTARPRRRASSCPTCATRGSRIERETLKLVVQHPAVVGRATADVGANDFTHPTYRGVWEVVDRCRRARGRCRRPGLGHPAARRGHRPCGLLGDQRARRRAAADRQGAGRGVRRGARLPAPGAHRACAGSPS